MTTEPAMAPLCAEAREKMGSETCFDLRCRRCFPYGAYPVGRPSALVGEKCKACGLTFDYGYICRQHSLCGLCHDVYDRLDNPEDQPEVQDTADEQEHEQALDPLTTYDSNGDWETLFPPGI